MNRDELIAAILPELGKVPMVDAPQSRIREIQAGWIADAILSCLQPSGDGEKIDALALQADEWEGKYQIVSEMNSALETEIAVAALALTQVRDAMDNNDIDEISVRHELSKTISRLKAAIRALAGKDAEA